MVPPPSRSPLIRLDKVAKTFVNGRIGVSGLDLEIAAGDFIALLGSSGCGKSTTLRLLAGLSEPSAGTVTRLSPLGPGEVGFVFQDPTLMPWANAAENVYLPLRLQGIRRSAAEGRIHEALARVGLADAATAFPRELSGGMRMRVSIARALVTEPRLLLMDEPFAALDEITRNRLNHDLLALWQDQRFTVVFVTHSVFESVFLAERIPVMAADGSGIIRELTNPKTYPRADDYRLSPAFSETCRTVSTTLADAMAVA